MLGRIACLAVLLVGLASAGEAEGAKGVFGPRRLGCSFGDYLCAVLGDSPDALWPLNEPSGTTFADITGHGHTATIQGSGTLGASSIVNTVSASFFSNDSGWASFSTITYPGDFSVEFWIEWPATTTEYAFVCPVAFNGSGPVIAGSGGSPATLKLFDSSVSVILDYNITSITPARRHFVWTRSGTTVRVYVDGVLFGTTGTSNDTYTWNQLAFGFGDFGATPQNETMGAVALYGHALNGTQISNHYALGDITFHDTVNNISPGPTAWWWMDEASGNLVDHAGARTATANGSPVYQQPSLVMGENFSIYSDFSGYFTFTNLAMTGDFTVAYWYMSQGASDLENASFFGGTGNGFGMFSSNLTAYDNAGTVLATADRHIDATMIQFVAIRRSGTSTTIWENGTDATTTSNASAATVTLNALLNSTLSGLGPTTMQEALIWNGTALSDTDVVNLYVAGH